LSIHGAISEIVPSLRINFDMKTVAPQEDVSGGEGDPL